ncbi:MAG: long-chain fatty acid--CoA ligase [Fuerstiella sp.]|nr:long-chain fatty acid--CoA ligase [Fuerstiella sp.]MCP4857427.1 long-chain fatty acid--CoA ligase [Fuerstiella sp.]
MATISNGASSHDAASNTACYPVGVPRRLDYPDIPAWGLLDRAAGLMPGRLACHYNDVEWTWEELNLDAIRTAAALRRLGVKPGDRVGILLPNIPEYLIALNGIWRAKGIAVALSPMAVPEEIDRMLKATNCRVVVSLDMLARLLSGPHRPDQTLFVSLRPRLPLFEQLGYLLLRKRRTGYWWMSANEHVGWFWDELMADEPSQSEDTAFSFSDVDLESTVPEALRRRLISESPTGIEAKFRAYVAPNRNPGPRLRNDPSSDWASTPAYILPTGGTTGEPKAVTLSHRNLVANAWQQYYWAGAAVGKETLLSVLPFFHSYGLSTNVLGGAAMIGTLIMDHRFSPRKVIRLIERHRPTVFHAVPAMLVALNEILRQRPADLASLKWVICGGATLPEAVGREFAEHSGALVVEGYGLSEASPVTHVGPLNDASRFGCIGLPLPDTECRIVDAESGVADVEPGEIGELLVRGPQVMLGYWDEFSRKTKGTGAESDEQSVVVDGWLRTGDLARLAPDGLYQIVERKKDLVITSGFNVYPQEVEQVLERHPSVRDAAVVGVPDEHKGETVKAFVVLHNGTTWDEAALSEFCTEHLAVHKRPRAFEHCKDDLPRSFLGKVIRRKLREPTLQGDSS